MPVNLQYLTQAIVGIPGNSRSQATTASSAIFDSETGLRAGKMYLLNSNRDVHLEFGIDGSAPTATTDSWRLPKDQILAVSTDQDIEMSIIRGSEETTDGIIWVAEQLETAAKL